MRMRSLILAGVLMMSAWTTNAGDLPPDEDYVQVDENGHLSANGERLRFWGVIGNLPGVKREVDGDVHFQQRKIADRLEALGFNMLRAWHFGNPNYEKGDGSHRDLMDFLIAELKKRGFRIWAAGLGGGGAIYEDDLDRAAKLVDDPETEEEWKEAVRSLMKKHYWSKDRKALKNNTIAIAWDPRLEAYAIETMKKNVDHVNQHTGLRYADDPVFAVWELTNEQWWIRKMGGGQFQKLHPFFKKALFKKWHEFLEEKYGTEEKIKQRWGFLLPGESLEEGTILLAPTAKGASPMSINDTNPQALKAFENVEQKYGRDDFNRHRGEDVLEFFMGLILSHKQRWDKQVKTWGKSCKLSPLLYDTGIGYNIQSQYLHQNADAVSHDAYLEGMEVHDPNHKRYPWYSGLDIRPRICRDVPWLEHNKVEKKPYLCYETQIGSPSKFRAEFPMRLAALASIQDWDAMCWHYYSVGGVDFTSETPFNGKLSMPGPGAFQYHYTFDEVQSAAMRAAAEIITNDLVKPAPIPTKYTYGKPALYDPALTDYAGSYGKVGWNMMDTTYRYGVRIEIDPAQEEFVKVDGKQIGFNHIDKGVPIIPNEQIEFDYQKSHLIFDAPGTATYVGFFAQYGKDTLEFKNGVSVGDITIVNPENSPYPVTNAEKYFCFSLTSSEKKPLAETNSAVLSLVSTSFNTGLDVMAEKKAWGDAPVLVTRVGATVKAPQIDGMTYVFRDWNMKEIGRGTVKDGTLTVPADQPVFIVELSR